jgi:hypothetical protein
MLYSLLCFFFVNFSENAQKLFTLEDAAKASGKGKWNEDVLTHPEKYIRDIKWTIENPRQFVDSYHQKPMDGNKTFISFTKFIPEKCSSQDIFS